MHPFHAPQYNVGHDPFQLGDLKLNSRVLLGTSRYPNQQTMLDCLDASGTEMVTISLRRVPTHTQGNENLYQQLKEREYHLLPNTAGCFTAKEAILTAELSREALETNWIKLEVIADEETLLPDGEELLEAAEILVRSGFQVLPYTNDAADCGSLSTSVVFSPHFEMIGRDANPYIRSQMESSIQGLSQDSEGRGTVVTFVKKHGLQDGDLINIESVTTY